MSTKTAAETWVEMGPRERDAWVAEHVLGWKRESEEQHPGANVAWFVPSPKFRGTGTGTTVHASTAMPHSSTADADYEVLKHVRETWGEPGARRNERSLLYMFAEYLHEIQYPRKDGCMGLELTPVFYKPGDYSAAAYLSLNQ